MGVMGTWCQICGIPVQHDHYVQLDDLLGIYRGGEAHEVCKPAFEFGPAHAWLKDAVALRLTDRQDPVVLEGRVHDGFFEDAQGETLDGGMVFDGLDERAALHRACWELARKPESWELMSAHRAPADLEAYQQQLFEFEAFVADGNGWMLADPQSSTDDGRRNRQRIERLLNP